MKNASPLALFVVLALPLVPLPSNASEAPLPAGTIQVPAGSGSWIDAPPSMPAGSKMMLLEGHPAKEGLFTMRLRLPAGSRIQPHWHPRDERVTILSGLARVGFGEAFDEAAMTSFGAGSFYVNPPGSRHYVWIVEETEMQLTGIGPWELHMLGAE
jgi:quercetin dioxygenase-like cupin family protein